MTLTFDKKNLSMIKRHCIYVYIYSSHVFLQSSGRLFARFDQWKRKNCPNRISERSYIWLRNIIRDHCIPRKLTAIKKMEDKSKNIKLRSQTWTLKYRTFRSDTDRLIPFTQSPSTQWNIVHEIWDRFGLREWI